MLASPLGNLRQSYDVVVVGSGYGGSITASRLARAGVSVCLFERGRERWPGEYPSTLLEASRDIQVRTAHRDLGDPAAMVDLHSSGDINVLVGCGLGGTSLINANVSLEPTPGVFDDDRWPSALRGEAGHAALEPHYRTARNWLGANPYPDDAPELPKLVALNRGAMAVGETAVRPPINVTFQAGPSISGVVQPACTNCGDCCSGCNVGAKNTTLMNYLPDAVHHGAEIYCETRVSHVGAAPEGAPGRWIVHFTTVGQGRERFDAPELFVHADRVVLAAGTLGSTEIMLRSTARGLSTSSMLGQRFTGNGDVLAFGADADQTVHGIGWGKRTGRPPVGPTIAGLVDLADQRAPGQDLVVEEGAVPGPVRRLVPPAVAYSAAVNAHGSLGEAALEFLRVARTSPDHLMSYLVMSADDDGGVIRLDDDRPRIDWHGIGTSEPIIEDNEIVARAAHAIGAEFVPDPAWNGATGRGLITVHPLGGCVMGDDATTGVVDHLGRVFTGEGDAVHAGLSIADGAVVPRPLDRNPLLTISALAERAAEATCEAEGWTYDTSARPGPDPRDTAPGDTHGIRFTERMAGSFALDTGDAATSSGNGTLEFVLTIDVPDVAAIERDSATVVPTSGTVVAPALSSEPLHVTDGAFQLMVPQPEFVETWHMHYSMRLHAQDGRCWFFDGHKVLEHRSLLHAWHDSSTLYVEVYDDADRSTPIGHGVLRIGVTDFLRQLSSMAPMNPPSRLAGLATLVKFGRTFVGDGLRAYGGHLEEQARLHQDIGAERALRLPEPEYCWFDGVSWHDGNDVGPNGCLRLTRYRGGDKGPIMLAAGYSMAASSYAVPTVDTTMAEYLVEHSYDVWLFDYRAGITLPSSHRDFTIDDVARTDWPAGVAEVRRRSGADDVQVLGHCVGSVSILMALLSGLEGVRSVVCSQYTTQPYTGWLNRWKNRLHISQLVTKLGINGIAPDTGSTWVDALEDLALGLVPLPAEEKCGVPVCSWLNAIFGLTHTHSQLNDQTHRALTEMFGFGETRPIAQLVRMTRTHRALDANGGDTYLPHVDRMGLPILFLQGSKNTIFRPEGTKETVRWLRAHHDPALFTYAEFPDYAHLDCFIGRNAATEIFPTILEHLEAHT